MRSTELRSLWIAVAMYVGVFALKVGAYLATGVLALLAEAFHTLADLFVAGFLLAATYVSRRSADERHMFGYGRAQNVAALVAATLFITFTSLRLYEEAIPRLFSPGDAAYGDLRIAIAVLVASMALAAIPLVLLVRQPDRGAAAKAQLKGLVNDQLGLVAALAGTILLGLGWPIADPLAAIAVATVIAWEGVKLFRENASMLLGQAPPRETIQAITAAARSVPGVVAAYDVRAEAVGVGELHAGLRVQVAAGTAIEDADRIAAAVRERVQTVAGCGYCVVQIESAGTPLRATA